MLVTILLLMITICSISITLPLWYGLKFTIEDPNCEEEKNSVNKNILALKIISTIITILSITCLILICI